MTIKEIFDEIANESGNNMKMEILGRYKDNELLKKVLYLANSKRIKFYVKQIPSYTMSTQNLPLENALNSLKLLSDRIVTGNDAIECLRTTLSNLSYDDAYIIERIIDKDCKIGMGMSNINKVFPKLIEDTPYMGAKAYDIKLVRKLFEMGLVYSQVKMDGRYNNAIIRSHEAEMESRQGESVYLEGAIFVEELKKLDDCVLNGELTIPGISRYESNGIIASLVSIGNKKMKGEDVNKDIAKLEEKHGMKHQDALNSIVYTVWDIITVDEYFDNKSDVEYTNRLYNLTRLLSSHELGRIKRVETKTVKSYEEAMAHFQEVLLKGEEGTILKSISGKWKDGKPNWQVKCKLEMDIDLKIVGFNYGTGKNEKLISSLNAESSDGRVFTRPTGIDEDKMKFITDNQDKLLGTIVECKCSGLSKDSEGNYALLHPVFKMLRDDKKTANSLDEIIKIEKGIKGLI